ncbi:ceramide synthase 5-like isoform X2 [Crassostrea virginica]
MQKFTECRSVHSPSTMQKFTECRSVHSPSTMQKFTECSYHFMFYCAMFIYGLFILWDKSWFWETKNCWIGWPKQDVSPGIYWYYVIELGFYWSLTFTLMVDHRRKRHLCGIQCWWNRHHLGGIQCWWNRHHLGGIQCWWNRHHWWGIQCWWNRHHWWGIQCWWNRHHWWGIQCWWNRHHWWGIQCWWNRHHLCGIQCLWNRHHWWRIQCLWNRHHWWGIQCLWISLVILTHKDFKEMVVHHLVTMALMYFSWVCNFVRVGTLVLLVHDAVDYWMAAAKMAKYCKQQLLCELFFAVFVVVWIVTRLIIYPFRILYTSSIEIYQYLDYFPSAYLFNALLIVLQILHILWTIMIFKIIMQKFTEGELKKDSRSESESVTSDDTTASEDCRESPQKHRMVTRQRAMGINGTT